LPGIGAVIEAPLAKAAAGAAAGFGVVGAAAGLGAVDPGAAAGTRAGVGAALRAGAAVDVEEVLLISSSAISYSVPFTFTLYFFMIESPLHSL